MAIRCRFVDSISAAPTVRLDLNAGDPGFWLGKGGLRCPPPPLKRAESDTMLWDGGTVAASAYGNRELGLPLSFRPGTMDLRNSLVSSLIKELNRETNILEYRPDGSSTSYFFRTFRSPNFDPTMWLPKNPVGMIDVDLYAEPFAYGLRVDQTAVSVKSDPALTNGWYLDVNGVTGDVETPALITVVTDSGAATQGYVAVRRHGTPSSLAHSYQAESGTLTGADTTSGADASASGGNAVTTTFATTAAFAQRVRFAPTEGVESRGTYRAIARVALTVATDTVTVGMLNRGVTSAGVPTAISVPTGSTTYQFIDLGIVQLPPLDSPNGFSGTSYTMSVGSGGVNVNFALWAGRTTGTGSLKVDYVLLIPADEDFTAWKLTFTGGSFVLDGPNDAAYALSSGLIADSVGNISRAGRIPRLQPGSNRVYYVEYNTSTRLSDTISVSASYWPRYLSV